jgi:hypothetical protein
MQNASFVRRAFSGAAIGLLCLSFAGCALFSPKPEPIPPPPVVQKVLPVFPPQSVMQGGDYAAFVAENEAVLKSSPEAEPAAIALFNLGFAYSYSKSPYYNSAKGTWYLGELVNKYPETVWAYQAVTWIDLLKKSVTAESKRRQLREELKSMQAVVEDLSKQSEAPVETGAAVDRQALEEEIRARDETINKLQRQLERYRQIDKEIEKKERQLLN